MPRELTIRSDSAYERSHRLAKKLGKSVTEVVDAALVEFEAQRAAGTGQYNAITQDDLFSPEAIAARGQQWEAIRERVRPYLKAGATHEHSDMYDEFGLPK
jgi:hypothetical protein